MPRDPIVWIVLIVAIALAVVFAVWKKRGVKGGVGGATFEITQEQQPTVIRVAEGAELEQVKAGDVAGVKGTEIPPGADIVVAQNLRAKHAELGDIVGVKKDGPS